MMGIIACPRRETWPLENPVSSAASSAEMATHLSLQLHYIQSFRIALLRAYHQILRPSAKSSCHSILYIRQPTFTSNVVVAVTHRKRAIEFKSSN
jgi:hypothetical protein